MNAQTVSKISAAVIRLSSGKASRLQVDAAIAKPLPIGLQPEEIYLLVSLSKHLQRQKWVAEIVGSDLNIGTADLGSRGLQALPEDFPRTGTVLVDPAWEYYFHGRGCCLTHRDGTEIDVDFSPDGSASVIDPFFYSKYLKSAANRHWYEHKTESREYLAEGWRLDLAALKQNGLINQEHESDGLLLTDLGKKLVQSLQPFLESIPNADPLGRIYRYALLGDWIKAQETADSSGEDFGGLLELSEKRRADRLALLRLKIASDSGMEASYAMAAMERFSKQEICADVLDAIARIPASALNLSALEILREWDDAEWKSYLSSNLEMHAQAIWRKPQVTEEWDYWSHADGVNLALSTVRVFLEQGQCGELGNDCKALLCSVLKNDFGILEAEAGSLLYLLDLKNGLMKLGAGLCSPVPLVRSSSAVYLAIIDTDLSVKVLQQGNDLPEENGGYESACGLFLSSRAVAKGVSQRPFLEQTNPKKELEFVWQCLEHSFGLKRTEYRTLLEKWNSLPAIS